MKTNKIISAIFMAMLMIVNSVVFTGCKKEDWGTDQFSDAVELLAYGPVPVARGGQLRFIGSHMDQVSTVTFPNCATPVKVSVVSETEVRCVVPQEAQPGYPVLTTKDGKKITAKTLLAYTEPVGFDEEKPFSLDTIKPGKELTINGEYLNLVQTVVFAEKVEVAQFVAKERDHITLIVPAEAQTGKVTLSFVATGDTLANEIASSKRLAIVLPSVKKLAKLDETKPGDMVVIAGEDFDLVTAVKTPVGDSLDFAFNADKTAISFTLPQDITPGALFVMAASGVEVPVATIGVALPNELTMTPAAGVRAGDVLTITGKDLDVVTDIYFNTIDGGTVEAEVMAGRTAGKIQVTVPESAISGGVVLNTASRVSVGPAEEKALQFETLKPAFKYFAATEVALGQDMVIYGQNMDLVVKATMTGGAKLEAVASTAGSVTFTLPYTNAETGTVELFMANGESIVTSKEISIVPPVCCYVTKWPELVEDEPIQAGTVLLLEVANRDKLTNVIIDGEDCGFILSGENKIYVGIPNNAGPGSKVTLVSSNGEIEYAYAFKPNTEKVTVVWKGVFAAGGWSAGFEELSWGKNPALKESFRALLQPGVEIVLSLVADPDRTYGPAVRFGNGSWSAWPGTKELPGADGDGNIALPDDVTEYRLTVTQEMIDEFDNGGQGLVICGAWFVLSKIAILEHISLETKINDDCVSQADQSVAWTFPTLMTWGDDGRFRILRNGANDLGNKVKAGMVMRFYKSGTGQIQVNNPNWTAITTIADWDGDVNPLELVVDQAILDCFTGADSDGWSETALILQGDGLTVEKITIE